jgi:hypothetical protein
VFCVYKINILVLLLLSLFYYIDQALYVEISDLSYIMYNDLRMLIKFNSIQFNSIQSKRPA